MNRVKLPAMDNPPPALDPTTTYRETEGSVLQGSVQATCLGFETRLELESAESPSRIRELLRNAEQGCFTLQALVRPVEVTRAALLNGEPLPS